MRPLQHLAYSTAAATGLLFMTKSPKAAIGCIASGVFTDLDHLIEYKSYCGDDWNWDEFSTGSYFEDKGTIKVIFHSWEIATAIWGMLYMHGGVRRKNLLYGIAVGYTLHLVLDQIGNNMNHMGYFELYRYLNGWNLKKLVEADKGASE